MDKTYDYLKELFIDEAKPSLERHSGGGVELNNQDLAITENGTYTADEGYTGIGSVSVSIDKYSESETVDVIKGLVMRSATHVSIPSGTTGIGSYAFYYDGTIESLDLPMTVKNLNERAFYNCSKLHTINFPDSVSVIGEYCFHSCVNLDIAKLPSSLYSLGKYAFASCSKLAITELPARLARLEMSVFQHTSIAITEIPSSINYIASEAFLNCKQITSLTFNSTPDTIAYSAFKNCTNLLTINVPWAEGAVSSAPWGATNATINYNYTGE